MKFKDIRLFHVIDRTHLAIKFVLKAMGKILVSYVAVLCFVISHSAMILSQIDLKLDGEFISLPLMLFVIEKVFPLKVLMIISLYLCFIHNSCIESIFKKEVENDAFFEQYSPSSLVKTFYELIGVLFIYVTVSHHFSHRNFNHHVSHIA